MEKTIEDYIELYKNNGYINEMRKYVGHAPIMSCACGVIIENAKGEILLQKRRDNGCWAIIGGAMEMGETFEKEEVKDLLYDKRTVELLLKDERQALERVMMQFSAYEKITEKVDSNLYRVVLTYEAEDEIDIIIRVLSFGPNLKVVGPKSFIKQINPFM